ncbi:hypothetical protein [Bradyrhizobium monzae]|uniref:hypothetical protein n=1 Tax=Bradyrhizobium sp. Oc8 TaxID=2876780 RepID=UPI001F43E30A|nr:hypothetical protein [Bradyrhizobium sp. Oc8]
MDDYRDLVIVSLTLLCAGIMLVAGQLYIEHHPTPASRSLDPPQPPQASPALISHAPSADESTTETRRGFDSNSAG